LVEEEVVRDDFLEGSQVVGDAEGEADGEIIVTDPPRPETIVRTSHYRTDTRNRVPRIISLRARHLQQNEGYR
jgi:hypothetical protein